MTKDLRMVLTQLILLMSFAFSRLEAQTPVSFSSGTLSGVTLNNPTSLQFGPDGRLYVAQQNGYILACSIQRTGPDQYQATATETIAEIRKIANHNDDGALNTSVKDRQITGLLVTGTAAAPILYVSSSDPRIGGGGTGGDKNLDTNSGVVSKLAWNGTTWIRKDVVLGLPRSEENHAVNGMQLDEINQILYLAVGGHTNAGAPSNNFAFLTEYALSAAILKIDLKRIDADFAGTYNLPTLDDPSRANSQSDGGDVNDPFGGNDGLNQAKIVEGGPVQIHSAGYRNAYDLVLTKTPGREGRLYTIDNGANGGWGGHPDKEGAIGDPLVTSVTNNYVVGEPGSTGPGPNDAKVNNLDNLHLVSKPGMKPIYGGHPAPVRANPAGAGLYRYDNATGMPVFETKPTPDWPPVPLTMASPVEGDFRNPGVNDGALYTWTESTNGMVEYTADQFFNGTMAGDLLTVGYDGVLFRIKLSDDGTSVNKVEPLASGFGSIPLDVTTPAKGSSFEGTIWVANYGSDNISILEPAVAWQLDVASDGSTPTARHECGFVEAEGKFYLIGGRETTAVHVFDPVIKKWTTAGSLPFKMHHFQPVYWQGKIYVMGAYQGTYSTGNLNNSESPVPNVYIYDLKYQSWTKGPAIPRPRGAAGLSVFNNELYLMGGIINGHQDGWVKWVDKFNPATGVWTQLSDMPRERDHFQTGVIQNKIYVAGGRKTNASGDVFGVTIPEVDVYDLSARTWTTLPVAQALPTPRAGAMTVIWEDQLIVAGGESQAQKSAHNQVQAFDPKFNSWKSLPSLSLGRHGTGMLFWNGKLVVAAGSTQQGSSGVTATMESMTLANPCSSDPNDLTVDADGDGFSNGDETLNGTNFCSSASRPADADGDLVSDKMDADDDNDGISDKTDRFVLDKSNGLGRYLPAFYPFLNGDPGTGFFGLGFTGIMSNGTNDYADFFDPTDPELIMGGAVGIANAPAVSGDALNNNQRYAFQYGFKIVNEDFILVRSVIQGPYFGGATGTALTQQSHGIFIGFGDQDNYIKLVLSANNGKPGFRILGENAGVVFVDQTIPVFGILDAGSIRLGMGIDRLKSTVSFTYQVAGQSSQVNLGDPVALPSAYSAIWSGQSALAAGIIASAGTAPRFSAGWDYLEVSAGGKPALKPNIPDEYTRIADLGNAIFTLDLEKIFEGNGAALTYQIISVSENKCIGSTTVSGAQFNAALLAGQTGTSSIVLRASNSDGAYADYPFVLKVISPPVTVKLINGGGSAYGNWSGDVNFSGGKLYASTVPIANTTDDIIYQTERYGASFTYSIPMAASGYYQLKLHFAEIYHGVKNKLGVGARLMDITAEGALILDNFDIFQAAGGAAKAVVVTVDSVHVTDNTFDLKFLAVKDQAKISGIQLLAYSTENIPNRPPVVANPGKVFYFEGAAVSLDVQASDLDQNDVLTYSATGLPASLVLNPASGLISGTVEADAGIYSVTVTAADGRGGIGTATFDVDILDPATYALRINAGGASQTFGSVQWRADQYFVGGSTYSKTTAIADTDLDAVYQSERYGKFAYRIPVPGNGRFKVNLLFAEKYFSGPGLRSFNVVFEGGAVKRSALDVFSAAGGSFKAYQEKFQVDVSDGTLDIQFESLINNAMVGGIEVTACAQPILTSVATSTPQICSGETATIMVSGSLNSADHWVLYSASCGGTLVATSTTGVFQVAPQLSTQYFIRAEGACVISTACMETSLVVNETPQIASVESSATRLCTSQPVTLKLHGRLGAARTWSLLEESVSGTRIAESDSGIFEVRPERTTTYVLLAEGLCSTTASARSVQLEVLSAPEVQSFTADRPEICSGESVRLVVQGKNVSQWTLYQGSCGEQVISASEDGIFDVRPESDARYFLRGTNSCQSEMVCSELEVRVRKPVQVKSVSTQSDDLCSGSTTTITVVGDTGSPVEWNLFAGTCQGPRIASSSGVFEVNPESTTTYYIAPYNRCQTVDACVEVLVDRVEINTNVIQEAGMLRAADPSGELEWMDCHTRRAVPGAVEAEFMPEESGSYQLRIVRDGCEAMSDCIPMVISSLEEEGKYPDLFPNPVRDKLVVDVPAEWSRTTFSIFSANGKTMFSGFTDAEPSLVVDVDGWPAGTYVIRFTIGSRNISRRFVKN